MNAHSCFWNCRTGTDSFSWMHYNVCASLLEIRIWNYIWTFYTIKHPIMWKVCGYWGRHSWSIINRYTKSIKYFTGEDGESLFCVKFLMSKCCWWRLIHPFICSIVRSLDRIEDCLSNPQRSALYDWTMEGFDSNLLGLSRRGWKISTSTLLSMQWFYQDLLAWGLYSNLSVIFFSSLQMQAIKLHFFNR